MSQNLIYWPLLAQVLLPLLVLLLNAKRKVGDVKSGKFNKEKAAMDNEAWSKPVVLTSKNLANQFQMPVLFMMLCIVLANIDGVSTVTLAIASLFVMTRYFHAYIHVTSNYVPLRFKSFLVSIILLLIFLVLTVLALLTAT